MYRFKQQIWLAAALLLTLTACGGGSGGGDSTTAIDTVSTGVFIDSAVEGLQYETATRTGTTNSLGEYDYLPGETVTFSIGGIVLGSTIAGPVVTPLSIVPGATSATNPVVTNIVRLLLSLDSDGNPDNGITISSEVTTAANDLTVDFSAADLSADEGITSLLNNLPTIIIVSESVAQNHFNQTLAGLTKSTWGSLVLGSNAWRSDAEPVALQ
jgi:hypothetical protein